jgi:hypothetical protein
VLPREVVSPPKIDFPPELGWVFLYVHQEIQDLDIMGPMPTPFQVSGAIFALYAFAVAHKGIIDRSVPVHGAWELKGGPALTWGVFCLGLGMAVLGQINGCVGNL